METYKCSISGKVIPPERVEALKMLGVPQERWTCVEHTQTKRKQGLFLGEVGTSKLLLVDKVYDDSVRSVFRGAMKEATKSVKETESEDEEDETSDSQNPEDWSVPSNEDEPDPDEKVEIVKRHDT